MNHILFRMVELEGKIQNAIETGGKIDRIVGQTQLITLDVFKQTPVRNYEESVEILREIDLVFGLAYK